MGRFAAIEFGCAVGLQEDIHHDGHPLRQWLPAVEGAEWSLPLHRSDYRRKQGCFSLSPGHLPPNPEGEMVHMVLVGHLDGLEPGGNCGGWPRQRLRIGMSEEGCQSLKRGVVHVVGDGLEEANGPGAPQRCSRRVAGGDASGLQALLEVGYHLRFTVNRQHDLFGWIHPPKAGQAVHNRLRLIDRPLHHGQDLIGHRNCRGLPVVDRWLPEGVEHGGGVGSVRELRRRMNEGANGGTARLHESTCHIR